MTDRKLFAGFSFTFLLMGHLLLALSLFAQAQNPIGYWTFDEGSGNSAADSTGKAPNAAFVNGITWVKGKIAGAVSADAAKHQSATIAEIKLSDTRAVTVSLWSRRTYSTGGGHVLFEATMNFRNSVTGFIFLPDDDTCGGISTGLRGNLGYSMNCYSQPSSGVWHHLVVVFDKRQTGGNQVTFYVDGSLQTPTRSLFAQSNTNTFGNSPIYLFSSGGASYFDSGMIDDFRIYDHVLMPAQIQGIYEETSKKDLTDYVHVMSAELSPFAVTSIQKTSSADNTGLRSTSSLMSGEGIILNFPTLISLAITPTNPIIPVGRQLQFAATGTYSDGSKKDLTNLSTWVSKSPSIATVNGSGLATALSGGVTTIQATSSLITGSTTLTVTTHSVALSWTASTSPVVGYNAYSSAVSGGPYTKLNSSLISTTNYTDQTVQSGHTYYYVTTAVDSQGRESAWSNQAFATVP